jgi:hypothetical protein
LSLYISKFVMYSFNLCDTADKSGVFGLTTIGNVERTLSDHMSRSDIAEEPDNDIMEGLRELDAMAQTIREEVEEEKANEMFMKKALVKPWRTITGKPQVIVEDIEHSNHPPWEGHKPYRPPSPNAPGKAKPPMPVHQQGIIPATKANVLAGGRRRARTIHRDTPYGGPLIQKCVILQPASKHETTTLSDLSLLNSATISRSWSEKFGREEEEEEGATREQDQQQQHPEHSSRSSQRQESERELSPPPSMEEMSLPRSPPKPLPRLVSIIQKRNDALWKKPTGKQALREMGFPVR